MKLLLYCTKAKPYLEYKQIPRTLMEVDNSFEGYRCSYKRTEDDENFQLNGKIVAECDFEVEKFDFASQRFFENDIEKYNIEIKKQNELLHKSCLTATQMVCYLDKKGKGQTNLNGYAIHINNLKIFDEPYELGKTLIYNFNNQYIVEKAPQNMMKVYNRAGECHILISIRPEWLCKILNNEKTIEVRKKVLKEMLKWK